MNAATNKTAAISRYTDTDAEKPLLPCVQLLIANLSRDQKHNVSKPPIKEL